MRGPYFDDSEEFDPEDDEDDECSEYFYCKLS
ncbi:hypothetical protein METP1_00054 [Methanosarcinales archaeon]|nr:hypothetical protein METP1_00054 [Methanosarcinales archaeon]